MDQVVQIGQNMELIPIQEARFNATLSRTRKWGVAFFLLACGAITGAVLSSTSLSGQEGEEVLTGFLGFVGALACLATLERAYYSGAGRLRRDLDHRFKRAFTDPTYNVQNNWRYAEVESVIRDGANINQIGPNGSFLHHAMREKDIRMVRLLLREGIDLSLEAGGKTALRVAIETDFLLGVQEFERVGEDVRDLDQNGMNSLMRALLCKSGAVATYLIQKGIGLFDLDNKGRNVYFYCQQREFFFLLRAQGVLLTHDSILCLFARNKELAEVLVRVGYDINQTNLQGDNALHILLRQPPLNIEQITVLLKMGINPYQVNVFGQTPVSIMNDTHPQLTPLFMEYLYDG